MCPWRLWYNIVTGEQSPDNLWMPAIDKIPSERGCMHGSRRLGAVPGTKGPPPPNFVMRNSTLSTLVLHAFPFPSSSREGITNHLGLKRQRVPGG